MNARPKFVASRSLAAVIEPGRGPRSSVGAGHHITLPDPVRALAELSGRLIRVATSRRWSLAAFGPPPTPRRKGPRARLLPR
jgi:hypothetical protein